ncbi:MAG TPA: hypothetical protein VL691_12155 [Vicinamibacteria bacterium]|nr:hypothetical protein [Vicinamibacteria bacterium]
MRWASIAFVALGLVGGMFWVGMAIAYDSPRGRSARQRLEDEAKQRKESGYKVNFLAPFIWFSRTRIRMVSMGVICVALGLYFATVL